jgi:hypothetical protein
MTLSTVFSRTLCVIALTLVTSNAAFASNISVTIDTTALNGTTGSLFFDLVAGGSATNTSVISTFSTDGTLGSVTTQGDAIGSLGSTVTMDTLSTALLNEMAQNITFGTKISFNLNFTENGPTSAGTPDAFSFFLADNTGTPIPTTTDPTTSNALFLFNIDGTTTGNLNTYTSTNLAVTWQVNPAVTAVPVPSAIWLFLSGMIGLLSSKRKTQRI